MYKGTNRGGIADWVWLKRNGEKELDRAMDEEEWIEQWMKMNGWRYEWMKQWGNVGMDEEEQYGQWMKWKDGGMKERTNGETDGDIDEDEWMERVDE